MNNNSEKEIPAHKPDQRIPCDIDSFLSAKGHLYAREEQEGAEEIKRPVERFLEQDHRAIKRWLCASKASVPSGEPGARRAGYETIHMIRKIQAWYQFVGVEPCAACSILSSRSLRDDG